MKNTGKPSEDAWKSKLDALGKRAFYHRLVDAAEIRGRTGVVAISAAAQPSDYILVLDGETSFAEVKSTTDPRKLAFNLLKKTQSASARMILAAGGTYWIFAHNLTTDTWYRLPYQLVKSTKEAGRSSLQWDEISHLIWTL